ncbi:MAG: rod-binding protein [Planctomycetota bacterium]
MSGITGIQAALHSRTAQAPTAAQMKNAADGFESMFLHLLLEPLERSAQSLFGGGTSGEVMSGMFRQSLADQLAKSRPLGLGKHIESAYARHAPPAVPVAAHVAAVSAPHTTKKETA